MAITIKYFNSFVLKKTVNLQNSSPNTQANSIPVFTGLPWNPTHATNAGYPAFITSSHPLYDLLHNNMTFCNKTVKKKQLSYLLLSP